LTYTEEITEQGNRVQHGKGRVNFLFFFFFFFFFLEIFFKKKPAQRPEIRIVSLQNEEISSDALSVTGYEHYQAKDYRLGNFNLSFFFFFFLIILNNFML